MIGKDVVIFPPGEPPEEVVRLAQSGLARAREALEKGEADIVVLDEINVALHYGILQVHEVLDLLDARPLNVEIVLTGRGAPRDIIDYADLVTKMCEVKHYFADGVQSRRGIEE